MKLLLSARENGSYDIHEQERVASACVSAQSSIFIYYSHTQSVNQVSHTLSVNQVSHTTVCKSSESYTVCKSSESYTVCKSRESSESKNLKGKSLISLRS